MSNRLVVRAFVFDVGETLIDESKEYGAWADWLGVPRHTFSAIFGGVIASGRDYRETFQFFRRGFDLETERNRRAEAGTPESFDESDLYLDVRPALAALKDHGYQLGIAGNQTARAHELLVGLDLPVDWVATSAYWGVEKPAVEFFERIVSRCGCASEEIAYVGDRHDNDLLPARRAGLFTVFVRRGPWGTWTAAQQGTVQADLQVDSLDEIVQHLAPGKPTSG